MREELNEATQKYDKSERDLKALQSVGQIIAEVLKQLDEERCKFFISPFKIIFFYYFYEEKNG